MIGNADDIGDVVVRASEQGTPALIRSIAQVALVPMMRRGAVSCDGRGEVVTGIAMMLRKIQ